MFILLRNPTATSIQPLFEMHLVTSRHKITLHIRDDANVWPWKPKHSTAGCYSACHNFV